MPESPRDRELARAIQELARALSSGEEGVLLLARWAAETREQLRLIEEEVIAGSPNLMGLRVVWSPEIREKYVHFLKSKKRPAGQEHIKKCCSYLNRFMPPGGITTPEEVFDMFMACPKTVRCHLDRAFRNLLNFYERVLGFPKTFIAQLRDAIPGTQTEADRWTPPEPLVIRSMEMMERAHTKYAVFWHAVLDSGARPVHLAREMFERFRPERLEDCGRFFKYRLGVERRTKHAWLAYLTPWTAEQFLELYERGERITLSGVRNWFKKHKMGTYERPDGRIVTLPLRPKYVRKFAYNMMRLHGVERDVAMWLNGRKPGGVDPEHYAELELLADEQYPQYAAYLDKLRRALTAKK
ncbi:hypothetical protein DRO33_04985 [Candidatus Bathyarchaeota archaeon]|nr:MAG: hypothetical protein DRO33_04985 [Candidatus Bathyarchaeota archaeon]